MPLTVIAVIAVSGLDAAPVGAQTSLGSNSNHTVIGFGDSVAAGYGLSSLAQYSPSELASRFPSTNPGVIPCANLDVSSCAKDNANGQYYGNTTSSCDGDLQHAYPCDVARDIGDNTSQSYDYAIQGGNSNDVVFEEIPIAESTLSEQARMRVNVVTLTVGADDIDFSACLSGELTPAPLNGDGDDCLNPPTIDTSPSAYSNLQLSDVTHQKLYGPTGDQVGGDLRDNLVGTPKGAKNYRPGILNTLKEVFPNAKVIVTRYYNPFPGAVSPGQDPCGVFDIPAITNLALPLLGPLALSVKAVEYQDRDAAVATFLENQLNDTIAQDLASSNADLVPLDFTNHDMCATGDANDTHSSSNPWVFAPHFESFAGPKCQYPSMTGAEETNPIFSTNCVAHPTIIGQQKIADTITNALSRGLQHPRGSQPPDISATTTTSTSPHHGMLGSTLLTVGGFQYRLQVVRANEDPNGVQNTNTLSQPSVPPATPGTTYLRAVIRVHNLQADRAAPLPDLSEFPVSLGAPIGVFPPPTNSLLKYCWSESQDVLAAFYPGDDPTECSETTVAAVLDSGSVLGSTGIKPSSNADVTIYFSVPQNLPLRDFRIVASPSLALTAAEYASGVPLG